MHTPLPLIYDTATSLGNWRRALDAVAVELGAKAIALKIRRPDPKARDLDMLSTAYLHFSRSAGGLYYGLRYSKLQKPDWDYLSRQPAHSPALDSRMQIDTDLLDERGDYAYLCRKLGIRRRMGVRLNADRVWFDAMSIAFDKDCSNIPQKALADLSPLLPHLTKAVELSRIFHQLKQRYKAVLTALDHVRIGLAIALPDGEIIVKNAEADRLFNQRDAIWQGRDGRLVCADPTQAAECAHAIRDVAATANGDGAQAERLILISRKSTADPILLDVSPLKDGRAEIQAGLSGALLTFIDPTRIPAVKIDRLAILYDLTPAEAEVCRCILDGCSVAEIAERRDTSPVTAKRQ